LGGFALKRSIVRGRFEGNMAMRETKGGFDTRGERRGRERLGTERRSHRCTQGGRSCWRRYECRRRRGKEQTIEIEGHSEKKEREERPLAALRKAKKTKGKNNGCETEEREIGLSVIKEGDGKSP